MCTLKELFSPTLLLTLSSPRLKKLLLHYESFLGMDFYGFWPPVKIG
jgi:hypothetical protein